METLNPAHPRVVIATGNPGKLREMRSMLVHLALRLVAQNEFNVPAIQETGTTFVENAILKARHAARIARLPAIADDSGIVVDALDGAPGVYSARYAGPGASDAGNLRKLLIASEDIPARRRQCRFYCAVAFIRHADDPTPLLTEAAWDGELAREAAGSGGFGYDPIFYLPDRGCTSAELTPAEKNRISHRALALQQLARQLREIYGCA